MIRRFPPPPVDPLAGLAQAFVAGKYADVVSGVRALIQRAPGNGLAHKLLGSALQAQGKSAEAVLPLQRAVKLLPEDAQSHSNLGNALAGVGRFDEAIIAHQRAILLQPGVATPRYNLGCVYLSQGRLAEALEQFWQAFIFSPKDRELAHVCREVLAKLGDAELKLAFCRLNVQNLPDDVGALVMLGGLLLEAGNSAEAETWLRQAVAANPANPVAWSNLCIALQNRAALHEAIVAGQQAVELAPDWALAHNNLGTALRAAGAFEEARKSFLSALEIEPEYDQAFYNLGCVSADLGDPQTARGALIEAVQRNPRVDWLLLAAHACRQLGDWDGAELLEANLKECLVTPKKGGEGGLTLLSPFAYLTTPSTSADDQLKVARGFASRFSDHIHFPLRSLDTVRESAESLRVGLLSSDFRDHATAHLMTGVLEALAKLGVTLIAYDYSPRRDDAYRARLRQVMPEWVDVASLSDQEAAHRMWKDRLDIVIDLKGWTQGFRGAILAHRPAPVQMQWLGFPGTMGAPWIDYLIADPVVIPPGWETGYSEKVLRLPYCYQPNDCGRPVGAVPERALLGLPDSAWVMAAFHQPYKITRVNFNLWMRLLRQIPDAVLWLLEAPAPVIEKFRHAARDADVDDARLIWASHVPVVEHLGRLACADLALDAFPVNAHTTASDALWAGVPQVAWCGDTFVSRVSASVVRAAGLPELVANDEASYEALIVRLARDRPQLEKFRTMLQERRLSCPLFDSATFARHLFRGLSLAKERWLQGLPPQHLSV